MRILIIFPIIILSSALHVNVQDSQNQELMKAAESGNVGKVKNLLENNVNINENDRRKAIEILIKSEVDSKRVSLDDLFDNFDTDEVLDIIANIKYEKPDDKETPLIIGKFNLKFNIFPIEFYYPKSHLYFIF